MQLYPEDLRNVAGALGGLSSDTDHVQQRLDGSWGRLDSGWEWYAEEDITGYFQRASRELSLMAAMLEQMGQALVKTADLIEAADQAAVAFFELGVASGATGSKESPGLKSPALPGSIIAPVDIPARDESEGGPGDIVEQLWNWLTGKGWKTDEELAAGSVAPVTPATPTPIRPMPVTGPSEMYVSSPDGLDVRDTPNATSRTILVHLPDHTKLQVNTNVISVQTDGCEWYKVIYTDPSGNVLIGWAAQEFLSATQPQESVSKPLPMVWPSLPSLALSNPFGAGAQVAIINPFGSNRGWQSNLGNDIQGHDGIDVVLAQWADGSDTGRPIEATPGREVYVPVSGTIAWYESDSYTVSIHDIPDHPGLEVQITHVFDQVGENGTVKKVDLKTGDKIVQGDFLSYYGLIGHTNYPHVHITFKQYDNDDYTGSYHFLDPSSSLP